MTIIQMHTHTGEKSYFFITNKQCGKAHATAQEIQNALEKVAREDEEENDDEGDHWKQRE